MTGRRRHPFAIASRVFAERLRGLEPSRRLWAMVRSPAVDWERVIGHASDQLVLPAFAAALRDLALIDLVDEELGAFLRAIHAANLERNGEIRDDLLTVVGLLNLAGIEPVLLKGAIRLVDRVYPDRGWRMLRDLDLLIPDARWTEAIAALQRAGYVLTREDFREAAFKRPGGSVILEVHRELFSNPRQARLLRGSDMLRDSHPIAFGETTARLPSIDHQLVHLIGHGQIGHNNYAYGRVALRDRLEAAALVRCGQDDVDWKAIFARFVAAEYQRPLRTFLLSLNDCGLCALAVPGKNDPITALQRLRIALQTRSAVVQNLGLWAGWCAIKVKWQVTERDDGRPRIVRTLKRLLFERGGGRKMARAFIDGAPKRW